MLGLNKYENDCAVIKSAYRNMTKVCHPDKCNNEGSNKKECIELSNKASNLLGEANKALNEESSC